MKFFGEVLIFLLLFLTNFRVFIIKRARFESLVVLGPFSFLLSILMIFSWGIDLITTGTFILSLFVTLTNFHALIRFKSKLYIDHYSGLMKIQAIITSLLSVAALAFTVTFVPSDIFTKTAGVTETKIELQGSVKSGFKQAGIFSSRNLVFYEYSLFPDFKTRKNVAVLIGDKRSETYNYGPFLKQLAKEGTTICSADFYTNDIKWFDSAADSKLLRLSAMKYHTVKEDDYFAEFANKIKRNYKNEMEVLMPMLIERYGEGCSFFFIGDTLSKSAVQEFSNEHKDRIAGWISLDSIEAYKCAGFGCVEQTNPFIATVLGSSRKMDCTKEMVRTVREAAKGVWLKK